MRRNRASSESLPWARLAAAAARGVTSYGEFQAPRPNALWAGQRRATTHLECAPANGAIEDRELIAESNSSATCPRLSRRGRPQPISKDTGGHHRAGVSVRRIDTIFRNTDLRPLIASMTGLGQSRRLSDVLGRSALPPTPDVSLRRSEMTRWARTGLTGSGSLLADSNWVHGGTKVP